MEVFFYNKNTRTRARGEISPQKQEYIAIKGNIFPDHIVISVGKTKQVRAMMKLTVPLCLIMGLVSLSPFGQGH